MHSILYPQIDHCCCLVVFLATPHPSLNFRPSILCPTTSLTTSQQQIPELWNWTPLKLNITRKYLHITYLLTNYYQRYIPSLAIGGYWIWVPFRCWWQPGVSYNLCLMMFIGISIQINTTISSDNIISSYHQMLLLLVTHMLPLTFFGCVLSTTAVPVVVLLVAAYRGDSCSLTSAGGPWNGVLLLLSTIYSKKVIGAHLEQVGTRLGLINTREHPSRCLVGLSYGEDTFSGSSSSRAPLSLCPWLNSKRLASWYRRGWWWA